MALWSWFSNLFKKKQKPQQQNQGATMKKRALLVGINKYPQAPLAGCVNDVCAMERLLIEQYGFAPAEICVLTDQQATTATIMAKLNWLVAVDPGSAVMFHYSGHGVQMPTGNAAEPDGLAECICPVDFDWTHRHAITDKQFVDTFAKLPAGCVFNWVSDSCHSGDLERGMPNVFGRVVRGITNFFKKKPPTQSPKTIAMPESVGLGIRVAKSHGLTAKGMIGNKLDVGFVSGCRSDQTSADTHIDGKPCGALTYYLIKSLRKMKAAPLAEVVAAVNKDIATAGYTQRPQVGGARADKPFLG
jgi:hypothetical protein